MLLPNNIAAANGLEVEEVQTLKVLFDQWRQHNVNNQVHDAYYNSKVQLRNLGIAVPNHLKWVANSCGWARLAVDYLVNRSKFMGYVSTDDVISEQLHGVCEENDLSCTYHEAITSTLKHGCGFLTVTAGRAGTGDPAVVISAYPATAAAAVWNPVERALDAGMVVVALDDKGKPARVNLFMRTKTVELVCKSGSWNVQARLEHSMGRPLIEPLVYKPSLEKPLGQSRISKPVRDLVDDYIRASARTEIAAEFCASPQKYALGIDETAFGDRNKWDASLDALFAVSRDENGDIPTYGQLAQGTMQPNVDYQRVLACRMSAETSIPVSAFGVLTDNPESAEAITASKEDAVIEVNGINDRAKRSMLNVALMSLAILNDTNYAEELRAHKELEARFADPATPSIVSESDAIVKQASVLPWLADTDVILDRLGYTVDEQLRMKRSRQTAAANQLAQAWLNSMAEPTTDNQETQTQ